MNPSPRKNITFVVAALFLASSASSLATSGVKAAGEYVTLSAFSGHTGSVIQVSGGNFLPNEVLSVYGGQQLGAVAATSNAYGQFGPVSYTVPNGATGSFPITVSGGSETGVNSFYIQPYAPSITLSAASVNPFGSITVSGAGYMPEETVNIALASVTTSVQADTAGAFKGVTIAVPNIEAGTQKVIATGANSAASATGYLYINGFFASVSPSAAYLIPGQSLTFSGSGFAPSEVVDVTQATSGGSSAIETIVASASGSFKAAGALTIAANQAGQKLTYTLTGETSHAGGTASVSVGTLNPQISLSNYYLTPGSSYSVSATGFLSGEKVDLVQGSAALGTVVADKTGSATFSKLIFPITSAASVSFTATGETSSASATASTTVGQYHPYASASTTYATPLTPLTVSGGGFAPNEQISLAVGGVANVATALADKDGNFSKVAITMPFAKGITNDSSIVLTGTYGEAPLTIALTVAPFLTQLTPSSFYNTPGTLFTLTGTGFAPNERVDILIGKDVLGYSLADKNGMFTAVSKIPFGVTGETYTATGVVSKTAATVDVGLEAFNPNVTFSTYFGLPGKFVNIGGSGFAPGEDITLTYNGDAPWFVKADSKGNLSAGFGAPFGKAGAKIVTATGKLSNVTASATFSLAAFTPTMGLGTYYGTPGQFVAVTGTGFVPNEDITLTYNGDAPWFVKADSKGNLSAGFGAPFGKAGAKIVTATGKLSKIVSSASFNLASLAPTIGLSAYYGAPGQFVSITGSGFASNEDITLSYNSDSPWMVKADAKGNLNAGFGAPFDEAGEKIITATGRLSNVVTSATFNLAAFSGNIILSTYYGVGGAPIVITGSGYAPNESVAITYSGQSLASAMVTSKGLFTVNIDIPYSKAGDYTVMATGAISKGSSSATVTVATTYQTLQLGMYAGAPGSTITFKGSGYLPGEIIDISTDRSSGVVYSFSADSIGSFNNTGYIVQTEFAKGDLVLTVTGEHSLSPQTITYYVTGK